MADDSVPIGELDTDERCCALCAARERLRVELVQRSVTRITAVIEYARARAGMPPIERSKAILAFPDGIATGEGSSLEDAIVHAIEAWEGAS